MAQIISIRSICKFYAASSYKNAGNLAIKNGFTTFSPFFLQKKQAQQLLIALFPLLQYKISCFFRMSKFYSI